MLSKVVPCLSANNPENWARKRMLRGKPQLSKKRIATMERNVAFRLSWKRPQKKIRNVPRASSGEEALNCGTHFSQGWHSHKPGMPVFPLAFLGYQVGWVSP
jgi:hypothetical protein